MPVANCRKFVAKFYISPPVK